MSSDDAGAAVARLRRGTMRALARTACLLCGMSVPVSGQPTEAGPKTGTYVRRMIDRRDGLPESQVNSVTRSSNGYFWLGTRRGLVRYDGLSFTLYEPGNTPALPSPWINQVRRDSRERLWLATGGGLAVRDEAGVHRIDSTQIPAVDVWSTFEDRRGAIWVATERGAFVGDGQRFSPVPGAKGFLYLATEDQRGRIWLAGRGVLGFLVGDSLVDVAARLGIRGRVFAALPDGPDHMWLGTQRGATRIQFDATGTPRVVGEISTVVRGRPRPVWALERSADGALWLGTETGGTLLFDGVRLHAMSNGALETWAIFADASGVVWAGTGGGLERYQRSAFTTLRNGLPDSPVWLAQLSNTGALWAALGDGTVYRFAGTGFSRVFASGPDKLSVPIVASGDAMLVAAGGRSVVRVDADDRRSAIPWQGPPVGAFLGIHRDSNTLWISADSGLYRLADGFLRPMNSALGLPLGTRPRQIAQDSAGRLYFGRPWLTVLDGNTSRRYDARHGLTSSTVQAILPRGAFTWIGTRDSGLYVLHRDTIRALGLLDPRLKREILGLGADNDGSLWISWTYGLVRVALADLEAAATGHPARVRIRSFDQTDGLPAGSFRGDFQSRLARDRYGSLYAPNAEGVVRIDPRAVAADTTPPPIVIESVLVDGRPVSTQRELSLPSGVGRIEFAIATPGALRPTEVRLQYRLVGVDTAWLDAGLRRMVSFGPLRGGGYRFEARAATEDGEWSATPAAVVLEVNLRLRERPWFLPMLLLATGGGVLLATRARRIALERRGQVLASEVAARTAELEAARDSLESRVAERTAQLAGELTERERLQRALVESQKLEGLGRLAGGVAHEINNGMTSVLGFTELATLSASTQPALLNDLEQVRRAGERITAIVRQLLQFARRQQTKHEPVAIGPLVTTLQRSLDALVGERVQLHVQVPDILPRVRGDSAQLEQVLINLVVNARDAMPDGGEVWLRLEHRQRATGDLVGGVRLGAGDYVWLGVRDSGRGIEAAVRERLFEPFFTTKGLASGTGLGLAVSHGIVREHGGAIAVESTVGHGATFEIWLPALHDDATSDARRPATMQIPAEAAMGSGETILVVDDDAGVRESITRHLAHAGYQVRVAESSEEALAMVATVGESIDLIVSDVKMPDLDGLDFARRLYARHGPQAMVFLTGSAGYEPQIDDALELFGPILAKPVSQETLHRAVRAMLDARVRESGAR